MKGNSALYTFCTFKETIKICNSCNYAEPPGILLFSNLTLKKESPECSFQAFVDYFVVGLALLVNFNYSAVFQV